jgi:hypothetical protein
MVRYLTINGRVAQAVCAHYTTLHFTRTENIDFFLHFITAVNQLHGTNDDLISGRRQKIHMNPKDHEYD